MRILYKQQIYELIQEFDKGFLVSLNYLRDKEFFPDSVYFILKTEDYTIL